MPAMFVLRLIKTKVIFQSLFALIIIYTFELGNTTVSTGQEKSVEIFCVSSPLIFTSIGCAVPYKKVLRK